MDLRFYCFVHCYLSPIQHGIQAGHCAVDLVTKYMTSSKQIAADEAMVLEWARKDKTFIVLNGGNSEMLVATYKAAKKSGFPFAEFEEDHESMRGLVTAVGLVLPPEIYKVERTEDGNFWFPGSKPHAQGSRTYDLLEILKSSRLA